MRIAPGTDGVSIWSPEIFGTSETSRLQEFLSRTFAVGEVESVELQPSTFFGRIRYRAASNPRRIWKKLSRALSESTDEPAVPETTGGPVRHLDASLLFLDGPSAEPVHVSRIGGALSTWRVRHRSENRLRLWHPILRNRRDVAFRLEEELGSILGVEDFRVSVLAAGVTIRFDKKALTVEHLARELEKAWPRLLDGLDGPPSRKRFVVAGGLLALAFTGQYLVPALRPVAVAGVVLYSLPNVIKAVKQLARGEIGLYALYSAGLGFLLISGLPFASTAITVLMQVWPRLARRKFVSSQRRLFGPQRRRAVWARIPRAGGLEIQVNVDELNRDDLVVVRSGDTVPVDGFVQEGSALVAVGPQLGADHLEQRIPGDWIGAGALVRDGHLTVRVERTGSRTAASYVASLLPHGPLPAMPSLVEAERIANRNARPTLALSALTLAITRTLRPAQAVIRPDYITAPRLSAQLSALHALARGSQAGIFFRNPAALDRIAGADVYVVDDTAGLERRRVEVSAVQTANGVAEALVADHALTACGKTRTDESRALASFTSSLTVARPGSESVRHHAGVTRYRDHAGSAIEVATAQYVVAAKIDVPKSFRRVLAQHVKPAESHHQGDGRDEARALQPLWVLKDGQVTGVVSFARTGEMVGKRVVAALKAKNKRARFVFLSGGNEAEAGTVADALGVDFFHGGLDQDGKTAVIRGVGRPTVWIGDGTDVSNREPLAASTVSVSVASFRHSQQDVADILLSQQGLDGLPALIDIARAHALRLARDYRTVYSANALAVGGAFFARFNALRAGLLSNVGTGIVYARNARALDRLAASAHDEGVRPKLSASR